MTDRQVPFRIKATAMDEDFIDQYNRSSFHRHELVFVTKALRITVNQQSLEVEPKQIIVIPSSIDLKLEAGQHYASPQFYGYVLSIGDNYLDEINHTFIDTTDLIQVFSQLRILPVSENNWQVFLDLFGQLKQVQAEKATLYQQKIIFHLASLLFLETCQIYQSPNDPLLHEHTKRDQLASDIKQYVDDHFNEPITLQDTAKRFNISTSTVNRIFQKYYHDTLYQYLITKRLSYAHDCIKKGQSISHSWKNAGFKDYSNFYRSFIKHYHYRPHDAK
ncbi:AraC family transcriptional regulator [Aerococcus sp. UMB7834]|uniref:helix-turn-helix domain-containing protein n=1 Tax=Aerococcus sp. UMB7834 TaxID=3046342 RepID=UPI00254BB81F|nr:AraC family transcriptional regulator [Aerococcus sp. UMB7834]MDK6805473.1 AraC family transcriptional regulator [Aerococcus sp. UMB7834]